MSGRVLDTRQPEVASEQKSGGGTALPTPEGRGK